jgi:hypothetical protein
MARRRKVRMMEADEDMVKRLARIVGPMSAAQNAIDKAAEYMAKGWAVKYWFSDDNHIVVEGIAPEEMRSSCDAARHEGENDGR